MLKERIVINKLSKKIWRQLGRSFIRYKNCPSN